MRATSVTACELVVRLKEQPYDAAESYKIPVQGVENVYLRVVSTSSPASQDVERLTNWRNRYVKSFLTEFQATAERTRRWLTGAIAKDPSRILFMIEEAGQLPLGYIGLAFIDYSGGRGEPDSVVRGEPSHPGIMALALTTLLEWGRNQLGISSFGVRVLADNPAMSFYHRAGFREVARVPLEKHIDPDCVAWKEVRSAQPGGRWLIHMVQEPAPVASSSRDS